MAKSPNQKLKLLYLCRYLLRQSDEDHPLTVAQMIDHLAGQGVAAERKSVYDDMEALRLFGLDVQTVRVGSATGYFIGERDFQLPELKLLVDSVQSSRFITGRKSLDLIGKLESLASVHQARELNHQVFVRGRIKTMNESIYYNVDELQAAIDRDRAVTFTYYDWGLDKKRVWRRDGRPYGASPWALMWDSDNYYLIAYDAQAGQIRHYRVDKMASIAQTDQPRQGADAFAGVDMAAYSNAHFGMFSGRPQTVRLCFENALAGPVIDQFGTEVSLVPLDEGHFSVTVSVAVNQQFFGWLLGFGVRAKILAPASAAEEMRRSLEAAAALYR